MAIAEMPKRSTNAAQTIDQEKAADSFIANAGGAVAEAVADRRKVPTMIRFDRDLLQRVDAAARKRGVTRSAWICYVLSGAVDQD